MMLSKSTRAIDYSRTVVAGVVCCDVQCCVKTFDYRRSSTRVFNIAVRGRLKKHESGARPAEASLIDGECRVIARSALLHAV